MKKWPQFLINSENRVIIFQIVFNPVIYPGSTKKTNLLEGCLSYPGETYFVSRYKEIRVGFELYDINKQKVVLVKKGLSKDRAFIFQHEENHLRGITIATKGIKVSEEEPKEEEN